MKKLKLHTPDGVDENISRLAALFTQCVTETVDKDGNESHVIDFEQFFQTYSQKTKTRIL